MKRKREKCSKGLRHFSMKVCEKVKKKGVTTYNEVADELVCEYCDFTAQPTGAESITSNNNNANNSSNASNSVSHVSPLDYWSYDQKNVRRRVYDALNVLMAMNIISKEKKEIKWIGLPCNKKQECQDLEVEKRKKEELISMKSEHLKNLIVEQIALKSLIERNRNSQSVNPKVNTKIKIPFSVLNTEKKTNVDCSISPDKKDYTIQFDNTFELKSCFDVLSNLKLSNEMQINGDRTDLYSSYLPKMFECYMKQIMSNDKIEPVCFAINLPNYNLVNYEQARTDRKGFQSHEAAFRSKNELSGEKSFYSEEFGYEENAESDDQDENSQNFQNEMNPNSSDENSSGNDEDEENSFTDSISF